MPGLSGVELAIQLQQKVRNCRVLLLSGQAATADLLTEAEGKGYQFELLTKPIHPDDLLIAIRRISRPDTWTPLENANGDSD
jgi:CheY-like chemotaxis protein